MASEKPHSTITIDEGETPTMNYNQGLAIAMTGGAAAAGDEGVLVQQQQQQFVSQQRPCNNVMPTSNMNMSIINNIPNVMNVLDTNQQNLLLAFATLGILHIMLPGAPVYLQQACQAMMQQQQASSPTMPAPGASMIPAAGPGRIIPPTTMNANTTINALENTMPPYGNMQQLRQFNTVPVYPLATGVHPNPVGPPVLTAASAAVTPAALGVAPESHQIISSYGNGLLPQAHCFGSSGLIVALANDETELSPYQCLVRQQIEVFEKDRVDNADGERAQGRNRPIVVGQVGIRCRHCGAHSDKKMRAKGSVLYPSTLLGVYQTAQNMANTHLIKTCKLIPKPIRDELLRVQIKEAGKKTRKSAYGGGRKYWANALGVLGVVDTPEKRLRFVSSLQDQMQLDPIDKKPSPEEKRALLQAEHGENQDASSDFDDSEIDFIIQV